MEGTHGVDPRYVIQYISTKVHQNLLILPPALFLRCAQQVAEKVAKEEFNSVFAIVRPPGHHEEENELMGINKILIVDWDVHHGNDTQQMFWKDSRVMFFSVHRHEYGSFYSTSDDGSHIMIGEGPGAGYNINVPWESVAREFNPDIVIISAGFDAAVNDPLGGCRITPHDYSILLKKLMKFSSIMALEGGCTLNSLANSVLACVKMLLEDKPVAGSVEFYPFESTWRVIKAVREKLSAFWPILADKLPEELTTKVIPQLQIYSSQSEDEYDDVPNTLSGDLEEDVTIPLSKLNLSEILATSSQAWRCELSNIHLVEGMKRPCRGAMNKTKQNEVMWKTVPHRLFFGREYNYLGLKQFNDVLLQENVRMNTSSPFFDLNALDSIEYEKNVSLEALKGFVCSYFPQLLCGGSRSSSMFLALFIPMFGVLVRLLSVFESMVSNVLVCLSHQITSYLLSNLTDIGSYTADVSIVPL
ncbi:hypothetical protein M8C21_033105 [Ambrosia artemisiifolia]|uniref:Histone deacetylase domain-containing protein n=1 Tax=Ambrosia artemisiifolia TaxID=4212 RepID=A0AAD5BXD9_AMBAR|nr:hypothetical protein M8C21_033105 [Ambrosia artemisiifolia]